MHHVIRTRKFTADGETKVSATNLQTGARLSNGWDYAYDTFGFHRRMAVLLVGGPVEHLATQATGYTFRAMESES